MQYRTAFAAVARPRCPLFDPAKCLLAQHAGQDQAQASRRSALPRRRVRQHRGQDLPAPGTGDHRRQPDRRAHNLDNFGKDLLDALTAAGVWADDSLIDVLIFQRVQVVKGGQVAVTITALAATLFEEQT